jgi:hypothetical protein
MPHETTLIATIVAGLVLAFIGGIFAGRLRLPAWLSARRCSSGVFHAGFVVDETLGAAPRWRAIVCALPRLSVVLSSFATRRARRELAPSFFAMRQRSQLFANFAIFVDTQLWFLGSPKR